MDVFLYSCDCKGDGGYLRESLIYPYEYKSINGYKSKLY